MEYTLFSNNHQQNFISPIFDKETLKKSLHDPSLWSLLISNFITIFFAIRGNWNITTILFVYWCQSLIIGFFHHVESLAPKNHLISTNESTADLYTILTYRALSIFLTVMSFLGYLFIYFLIAIFIFSFSSKDISIADLNSFLKIFLNSFVNFNFLISISIFFSTIFFLVYTIFLTKTKNKVFTKHPNLSILEPFQCLFP